MTSGATYCGVPQMVSSTPSARVAFLASPKSAILMALMSPGAASSRFSSFRSRCATPLLSGMRPDARVQGRISGRGCCGTTAIRRTASCPLACVVLPGTRDAAYGFFMRR